MDLLRLHFMVEEIKEELKTQRDWIDKEIQYVDSIALKIDKPPQAKGGS